MKKLFSIVLAVVMVLSVASMAMAFSWNDAPAKEDAFGYKIEVIKYVRQTGAIGSSNFIADPNAAAVNGADVYFAIKLIVPDLDTDDAIREQAKVKIAITALNVDGFDAGIKDLPAGTYYYTGDNATALDAFKTISQLQAGTIPVFSSRCLDTDTAKVYAKVSTGRELGTKFKAGSYWVTASGSSVTFADKENNPDNTVTFERESKSGKVDSVKTDTTTDAQFVVKLYNYLGITAADVADGKVYMSDDNLRAAFGFAYKVESTATWKANSTPIILDPTVTIPKTGDNASVIGFAMIMVAVVAAAVAVKKVKA